VGKYLAEELSAIYGEQAAVVVLLVGGSSVGKTRCAVEAVKSLLPVGEVCPMCRDRAGSLA
jgi:hypothetical protein